MRKGQSRQVLLGEGCALYRETAEQRRSLKSQGFVEPWSGRRRPMFKGDVFVSPSLQDYYCDGGKPLPDPVTGKMLPRSETSNKPAKRKPVERSQSVASSLPSASGRR